MSHISLNRKRNSHSNNIRSRIVTETTVPQQQKQNFNIDQNINQNLGSIRDTITMLKQYEKLCIEKEDFLMAEQTKNKIQFLEIQQKTIEKERGILRQQVTIQTICKEGEEEVQNFQSYWDDTIKSLVQELKDIQSNFVKQQQVDLKQCKQKISNEQGPKVKYSPKILQLRKHLTSLIKMRKYKQADEIKNKLRALEIECQQIWGIKNEDRSKILVQKFQKRQTYQLKALRTKLQTVFNQKIKQRDQKFEILLKRNRKRQIQSSKSKISKMKQSTYTRSKSQSRVALGNSKLSILNSSTKS